MAKPSVYIETTIVSYLTARPSRDIELLSLELATREWWSDQRPHFDVFTSRLVITEASAGDAAAAASRIEALAAIPLVEIDDAARAISQTLISLLSLPARAAADALHVAIAATAGLDFLLTWNCKHLANGSLAAKIERGCRIHGYVAPRILTPHTLMVDP